MKAFVFTCLLAVATANPIFSAYSPLVPADAPDVAAAKIAHAHAHHEALSRGKRSPAYYGPPAPLNSDGTVARTPEVAAAAAYQSAAHAQEYQRLSDAAALAAAHPDTTSPQGSWDNGASQYNGNQQQWNGNQQQWNGNQQQQWNAPQQQWSGRSYNPAASQPAPLNSDGTVAPTKEYQQIAAAHAAAHQQLAPAQGHYYGRRRRSVALNPDGTVAPTPEVAAATAAHLAALNNAAARTLPAAYGSPLVYGNPLAYNAAPFAYGAAPFAYGAAPLALSPFGLYSGLSHYGRYAPAPLNHDGTVAQTPEYLAIAASHAAAHGHARGKRSVRLNPDGTVAPTPEVAAATAAHFAALAGARAHPLAYASPSLAYAAPYAPSYHAPAPLNPDGTVAETPEVAHLSAAHRSAQAQQLGLLAAQEALAVAAGPGEEGYAPAWNGAPAYYAGSGYHQPAPLNPDGTVAHTPEYLAVAASHAAARHYY